MKKQTGAVGPPRSFNTRKKRPTSADKQIGESLRAHRLAAGMSQGDLAKRLGVSFQQVQKYEKGTNRVGAGRLPQIAEIFGVPIGAFFKATMDVSPGKGTGSAVPVKLVTDTATVRLLTAYAKITDRSVRRHLSELVERIARAAKKKLRR
jgi:transcriptional regulator with XRE-family HTH domain